MARENLHVDSAWGLIDKNFSRAQLVFFAILAVVIGVVIFIIFWQNGFSFNANKILIDAQTEKTIEETKALRIKNRKEEIEVLEKEVELLERLYFTKEEIRERMTPKLPNINLAHVKLDTIPQPIKVE